MIVIVPNHVRDAINTALDKALANMPPEAQQDREHYYRELLAYFNEHGTIPDFQIEKTKTP